MQGILPPLKNAIISLLHGRDRSRHPIGIQVLLNGLTGTLCFVLGLISDRIVIGATEHTIWLPAGLLVALLLTTGWRFITGFALGLILLATTSASFWVHTVMNLLNVAAMSVVLLHYRRRRPGLLWPEGRIGPILEIVFLAAVVPGTVSLVTDFVLMQQFQMELLAESFCHGLGYALTGICCVGFVMRESPSTREIWNRRGVVEYAFLSIGLFVSTYISHVLLDRLVGITLPFMFWCLIRFGYRGTAFFMLYVSLAAIYSASLGMGPIFKSDNLTNIITLQIFYVILTGCGLGVVAIIEDNELSKRLARDAESQYRILFDHSPDAVILYDLNEMKLIEWSRAAARLFGCPNVEMHRLNLRESVPQLEMIANQTRMRSQLVAEGISALRIADEKEKSVIIRSTAVEFGQQKRHLAILRDISLDTILSGDKSESDDLQDLRNQVNVLKQEVHERLRAEGQLRLTSDKYVDLGENLPGMLFQTFGTHDGSVFDVPYISDRCYEYTGWKPEEIYEVPMRLIESIHQEDLPNYLALAMESTRKLIEKEVVTSPFEFEFRCVSTTGQIRWLYTRSVGRVIFDDLMLFNGIAIDVTDRKEAEQALSVQEYRYQNLFEGLLQGILVIRDGKPIIVNQAWARFHGCTVEEIQQLSSIAPLIASYDRERVFGVFDAISHQRLVPDVFEYEGAKKSGGMVWLECTAIPIEWEGGTAIQLMSLDVTHRKRAERELKLAYEKLEQRVADRTLRLGRLNQTLKQEVSERKQAQREADELQGQLAHASRLSLMGEMAAGIAHEVHQRLEAIKNFAAGSKIRLNNGGMTSQEIKEKMALVADESLRAGEVLQSVKNFIRHRTVKRSPRELGPVVKDAVRFCKHNADRNGVAIECLVPQSEIYCSMDSIQITQVLINLIFNGIDSFEGAPESNLREITVRVEALEDQNRVGICILDRGVGIPEALREKIFEQYYTTKEQGLGMGLSISRRIVNEHEGQLSFTSSDDAGTEFRLQLPTIGEPGDLA